MLVELLRYYIPLQKLGMLPIPAFWAAAAGPSAVGWLWLHSSVRSAPFVTVGSVLEAGTDSREDVEVGATSRVMAANRWCQTC